MSIELLNTDCMEYMATLADGAFDLAIVDPPCGVGSVTYMPCKREQAHGGFIDRYDVTMATIDIKKQRPFQKNNSMKILHGGVTASTIKNFGDFNVSPPPEYFRELFRVSKNQIIWGGNYFLLPPSRCFVVWDKLQGENFSFSMAELAWTSFQSVAKLFRKQSNSNSKYRRVHPTQKPPELYKFLLTHFAKPGDRILDTHLGSGTISWACEEMGFDLVGCEVDREYFEAAKASLELFKQQTTLPLDECVSDGDFFEGKGETENG